MLCIGIVMMPGYARMTRGQVLSVKQLDYVTAGKIPLQHIGQILRIRIIWSCQRCENRTKDHHCNNTESDPDRWVVRLSSRTFLTYRESAP